MLKKSAAENRPRFVACLSWLDAPRSKVTEFKALKIVFTHHRYGLFTSSLSPKLYNDGRYPSV